MGFWLGDVTGVMLRAMGFSLPLVLCCLDWDAKWIGLTFSLFLQYLFPWSSME